VAIIRWCAISVLAIVFGAWINKSPTRGNYPPVVNIVTCYTGSPAVNGQTVISSSGSACATATNSPTFWSISGCSSNLSIDNGGNITVNSTGAGNWIANNTTVVVNCRPIITATNSFGSGSATIAVNVYADGSTNAPRGSPRFSALLDSYHASGGSRARVRGNGYQPPWAIAGVDYAVGYPSGQSFTDPATGRLPDGCSRGMQQIICSSGSPTFDGWDFSLENGWQLICETNGTLTVTNSNFAIGSNGQAMLVATPACNNMMVTNSVFNANGLNDNSNSTNINFNGRGALTVEYCLLENAYGDLIDLGGGGTSLIQWNVFHNAGQGSNAHPDWLQFGSGTYGQVTLIYNLAYQTAATTGPGTDGWWITGNGAFTFGDIEVGRNTVVTLPHSRVNSIVAITTVQGAYLTGTATTHDNFVDPTGANNFARAGSSCRTNCGGGRSTFSKNLNMKTGTYFPNAP
jgi:hypothetical protein